MTSRRKKIQDGIETAERFHSDLMQRLRVLREMHSDNIAPDRVRAAIDSLNCYSASVTEAISVIQGTDFEPQPGPGYV